LRRPSDDAGFPSGEGDDCADFDAPAIRNFPPLAAAPVVPQRPIRRSYMLWFVLAGEWSFDTVIPLQIGIARQGRESAMSVHRKQEICVHIRWMIRRDMPEVLDIENISFEFPWIEDDFIRCLRQRNCIGMVAEHEERVVGFMIYELHKNQLHILNFAVHAEFRRRGVGRQMVAKLMGKLSHQRRNRILLEVRETNLLAQLFFRDLGFRAVTVLRDFYDDTTEDAYLMQYRHVPAEEEVGFPVNRIRRLAG
jgi:ribosomal-protein-alanine N-acetyltransferase